MPRAAEAHYCHPDTSPVSTDAFASVCKETASANVQTDDLDIAALTHFLMDCQWTIK